MKKRFVFSLLIIIALLVNVTSVFAGAPDNDGPYADTVVVFSQGKTKAGGSVLGDRSIPDNALGAPEGIVNPPSFVTLGFGGTITLGYTNYICADQALDIRAYEITNGSYPLEVAKVEVSKDLTDWYEVGSVNNSTTSRVDLPAGLYWVQYVRLTDISNPLSFLDGGADGYDLDAVQALHSEATALACIPNLPPSVNAGGPYSGVVGGSIDVSGFASDINEDLLTIGWTVNNNTACKLTNPKSLTPTLTCYDPGSFILTLTASDGKAAPATTTASVVVSDPAFIREAVDCINPDPQDYPNYAHKQTLFIPARNIGTSAPVVYSTPLESAFQYLIEVSGVYYAGGSGDYDIRADAKYSQDRYQRLNLLGWTDLVRNYASYTEVLLELKVDNLPVEWGAFNSNHTYSIVKAGNDSPMSFTLQIYDIAAYNNHGGLCVNLYQYVDYVAPVIDDHDDVTVEATGPDGALVNYTPPTTSDFVDGPGTATCLPESGSLFPLGNTTVTCNAEDTAGNDATSTTFVVHVVDTTDPVIIYIDRTPANGNGWNNDSVTLNWSCTDIVGVKQSAISISVATEGENQSVTGICEDTSGNTASDIQSGVNIDLTAPILDPFVSPNPVVLNGSAVATSGATDSLSGIAAESCDAVDTGSVGAKSVNCTATDKASNVANLAAEYTVVYASGDMCYGGPGHTILQPINSDGSSVFKQKSTVPAKFRVCDANGNSIGLEGVVTSFRLVRVTNGTDGPVDEAVISTTPDTAFRWSADGQQWIFNINTKNLSAGRTYSYEITLNDGSIIPFSFGLK